MLSRVDTPPSRVKSKWSIASQKLTRRFMSAAMLGAILVLSGDKAEFSPESTFEELSEKKCPANAPSNHPTYIAFTGGTGRVPTAISLYERDPDPQSYLYISGVDPDVTLSDVLAANDRTTLIPQIDYTIFFDHAKTTNANAIQSAMFLKEHCIRNVTLVTSDYHMPRARLVFDRALQNINLDADVTYVSVNAPPLMGWDKFEEDFKYRGAQIFHGLGFR